MRIGSACTGIGGIDLALERAGLGHVIWQIEKEPFCRDVLARHWPGVPCFEDLREAHPPPIDLLAAGFPCQPVSVAGRRKAQEDPRWLWPEIARLIDECTPGIVFVENVPGLRTAGLRDVLGDLAARGFDAEWSHFRASEIGAPHHRDRFWLIATNPRRVQLREQPGWLERAIGACASESRKLLAHAAGAGRGSGGGAEGSTSDESSRFDRLLPAHADRLRRLEQAIRFAEFRGWARLCGWRFDPVAGMDDGVPRRMGAARKALGNSVAVPCASLVAFALAEALGL